MDVSAYLRRQQGGFLQAADVEEALRLLATLPAERPLIQKVLETARELQDQLSPRQGQPCLAAMNFEEKPPTNLES